MAINEIKLAMNWYFWSRVMSTNITDIILTCFSLYPIFYKIKSLKVGKIYHEQGKKQAASWEKILVVYVIGKWLLYRISNGPLIIKLQITQWEDGQNIWTDYSERKKQECLMGIWEYFYPHY